MTARHETFLSGERPDDVALYLSAGAVDDIGKLADYGEKVDGGVLLVVDGEKGRNAFATATGQDAMGFAREAMATEGEVDADLTGGRCPECGTDGIRFVFAFAEERNEDVGGIYADGDVIHAYAQCACGTEFSDRWVASEG